MSTYTVSQLALLMHQFAGERDEYSIEIHPGVQVTFPGYGYVNHFRKVKGHPDSPASDFLSEDNLQEYNVNHGLWCGEIPSHWIPIVKSISTARKRLGISTAVDIYSSVLHLAEDHASLRQIFVDQNWAAVTVDSQGVAECRYADVDTLRNAIDFVINSSVYRPLLKVAASKQLPVISVVDYHLVSIILELQEVAPGSKVIDVGCGQADNIGDLFGSIDLNVVAIDRQFYPNQFRASWQSDQHPIEFLVQDARKIHFDDGYFDVALLLAFCGHQTTAGMKKSLAEVTRVLKSNGIIVVGPWDNPARYYRQDPFLMFNVFRKISANKYEQIW